MNNTKSAFLSIRVLIKTRNKFHTKARKIGKSSDVLREIVEAFNDDRLVIKPKPTVMLEKEKQCQSK